MEELQANYVKMEPEPCYVSPSEAIDRETPPLDSREEPKSDDARNKEGYAGEFIRLMERGRGTRLESGELSFWQTFLSSDRVSMGSAPLEDFQYVDVY